MIRQILKKRVSIPTIILGMVLSELLHLYLNSQFPHIF
jgi:hypothetical protein